MKPIAMEDIPETNYRAAHSLRSPISILMNNQLEEFLSSDAKACELEGFEPDNAMKAYMNLRGLIRRHFADKVHIVKRGSRLFLIRR